MIDELLISNLCSFSVDLLITQYTIHASMDA